MFKNKRCVHKESESIQKILDSIQILLNSIPNRTHTRIQTHAEFCHTHRYEVYEQNQKKNIISNNQKYLFSFFDILQ